MTRHDRPPHERGEPWDREQLETDDAEEPTPSGEEGEAVPRWNAGQMETDDAGEAKPRIVSDTPGAGETGPTGAGRGPAGGQRFGDIDDDAEEDSDRD